VSEDVSKRAQLSRAEAAAYLGVSVKTLDRQMIPRHYIGSRVVYALADLDAYLAEKRVVPVAAAPRVLETPRRARRVVRARRGQSNDIDAIIERFKKRLRP
jgi:hypothetical protein